MSTARTRATGLNKPRARPHRLDLMVTVPSAVLRISIRFGRENIKNQEIEKIKIATLAPKECRYKERVASREHKETEYCRGLIERTRLE